MMNIEFMFTLTCDFSCYQWLILHLLPILYMSRHRMMAQSVDATGSSLMKITTTYLNIL